MPSQPAPRYYAMYGMIYDRETKESVPAGKLIRALEEETEIRQLLREALKVIDTHIPNEQPICVPGISVKIRTFLSK